MKAKQVLAILLIGSMILGGCGVSATGSSDSISAVESEAGETATTEEEAVVANTAAASSSEYTTEGISTDLTGSYSDKQIAAEWSEEDSIIIECDGSNVTVSGDGVTVEDGVITITAEGCYVLRGDATEVQIVVNAGDEENVQLVFDDFTITNSTTAPIVAENAKNLYMTLADGTENSVTDARSADAAVDSDESDAEEDDTEPTAAIYSEVDLIINGSGVLTVEGNYNDGITTKDDLKIISGTITVSATDDGIVGHDSMSIRDGEITVTAGDDGLKVSEEDDTEKGYLVIDGGDITIDVDDKGIDVTFVIVINDGTISVDAGTEGIESLNIVQNGGDVTVTAQDDGINISDNSSSGTTEDMQFGGMSQDGGGRGGRPGENTESDTEASDATDTSAATSTESDVLSVSATSDTAMGQGGGRGGFGGGPNGNGGEAPSGEMPSGEMPSGEAPSGEAPSGEMPSGGQGGGRGGMGGGMMGGGMESAENIDGAFVMNGGTLTVVAYGDGIDSNGDMEINGGTITICGPTNSGNGSLDYNGVCVIGGGVVLIESMAGMQQTESSESTQRMAVATLSETLRAGTEITVQDEDGNALYTFTAQTDYNYVAVSAPEITDSSAVITIVADGTEYSTTIQ